MQEESIHMLNINNHKQRTTKNLIKNEFLIKDFKNKNKKYIKNYK